MIERLLLGHGASSVKKYLHDDEIIGAVDAEKVRIEDEVVGRVLADDLKAIVLGNAGGGNHRLLNDLCNLLPEGGILSLLKVDTYQRHRSSPACEIAGVTVLSPISIACICEHCGYMCICNQQSRRMSELRRWRPGTGSTKTPAIARRYARRRGASRSSMILHWSPADCGPLSGRSSVRSTRPERPP